MRKAFDTRIIRIAAFCQCICGVYKDSHRAVWCIPSSIAHTLSYKPPVPPTHSRKNSILLDMAALQWDSETFFSIENDMIFNATSGPDAVTKLHPTNRRETLEYKIAAADVGALDSNVVDSPKMQVPPPKPQPEVIKGQCFVPGCKGKVTINGGTECVVCGSFLVSKGYANTAHVV